MSPTIPLAILNSMSSPMEMAVVLVAILLLFGAKSLPGTLRTLGRWMEQLRQVSDEVKKQVMDAGEPLRQARDEWERESRDFTVSSGPQRPVIEAKTEEKKVTVEPTESAGERERHDG